MNKIIFDNIFRYPMDRFIQYIYIYKDIEQKHLLQCASGKTMVTFILFITKDAAHSIPM